MYEGKKILATICARGGSKGVLGKNFRLLAGKPTICYSLDVIKKSKYIDDYIVSTDSDNIIEAVKNHGFEIKFKRPEELAGDKVPRVEVVRHAVRWLEQEESKFFDIIVDLGVATPLKSASDVDGSIETLIKAGASNVISATPSSRNPYYNMVEVVEGKVAIVKQATVKLNDRRDAPKTYDLNDAINAFLHDTLFSARPQLNDKTQLFIMPPERSVDIDEEIDFIIAESILKKNLESGN